MHRLALLTVLLVALVAGCGDDEEPGKSAPRPSPDGRKPAQATLDVDTFLKRASSLKTASVRGRLIPIGEGRLVLASDDASTIVSAPTSFVRGLRPGGVPLVVTGSVQRLDDDQATALAEQASGTPAPKKRARSRGARAKRPTRARSGRRADARRRARTKARRLRAADPRPEALADARRRAGDPYLVLARVSPPPERRRSLKSLEDLEREER